MSALPRVLTATVLTHGDYQELPAHVAVLALLAVASYFRHPEVWARALTGREPYGHPSVSYRMSIALIGGGHARVHLLR